MLEAVYAVNPYPTTSEREEVEVEAGLKQKTVVEWFQNKRAREKRRCASQSGILNRPKTRYS